MVRIKCFYFQGNIRDAHREVVAEAAADQHVPADNPDGDDADDDVLGRDPNFARDPDRNRQDLNNPVAGTSGARQRTGTEATRRQLQFVSFFKLDKRETRKNHLFLFAGL